MYDMAVYHISQMLFLLGNPEVARVTGKTYQETALDPRRAQVSGYDVEELGVGFVRLAGNISLDLIESWAAHMDSFEAPCVLGSQGGIRLNPLGFFHTLGDMQADTRINLDAAAYRWKNVHEVGDVYDGPQPQWIAALQGRVPLLPTAEIALNTMLISEGIFLSERLGREVSAEEIRAGSPSTAVKV
jgi:predicted dehydrogenase